MLKIMQDGQEKAIGYSVVNNLIPTTDEAQRFMKRMLFEIGASRFNSDGSTSNYYSSVVGYDPAMNILFNQCRLNPHPFITGQMDLLDAEGNLVCKTDLYYPYSGDDEYRGSINRRESYDLTIDEVIKTHTVVDVPTHAGNSAPIKTIRINNKNSFYSCPYSDSKNNFKVLYRTDRRDTSVYVNFDDEGKPFSLETSGRAVYKGIIYTMDLTQEGFEWTDAPQYTNIKYKATYWNGKFYLMETFKNSQQKILLKPLVFNEDTKTIHIGTPLEINMPTNILGYRPYVMAMHTNSEGNLVLALLSDSYDGYYCFITVNPSTGEVLKNTSKTRIEGPSYYMLDHIFTIPSNAQGIKEYRWSWNNYYRFTVWDCEKLTLSTKIVSTSASDSSTAGTYYYQQSTIGSSCYINGQYYTMLWGSDSQGSSGGYGWGNGRYLVKRVSLHSNNYPIIITLDEPIQKTKEQTLKIVLDVDIE